MTTTTTEIEEPTEEGRDQDGTFTTTEDPTWSPPVSQTTGTAGGTTMADHRTELTRRTNPSRRSASGGRDNHAMAPERSARQKSNSMDRVPYTDSETSEESSGHPTPS